MITNGIACAGIVSNPGIPAICGYINPFTDKKRDE
jgi:hypothetical protein